MKIYEFLKVKKVKCIDVSGMCLSKDKEYQLLGVTNNSCIINDDDGYEVFASIERFEPVVDNDMSKSDTKIDISENSVNAVNNVIPTFKVGDKVYKFGDADVKTVLEVFEDRYMNLSNYPYRVNHESICYATQENYEMLCKLYPHIQFELPPKPLTKSDLTKGMFERGDFAVVCKCSNIGEISAITSSPLRLVIEYSNGRFLDNTGHLWEFAVPCNPKTNLPLTEGVLNDIN